MIVPTSNLPINPAMLANDNSEQPSQANLLMAAAEMHKMGKLNPRKPTGMGNRGQSTENLTWLK